MMNDTEFENILKQALRPDISDEEILVKKTPSKPKRRKSTMRKHRITQSAVAAAACLALILGIGYKTIKPENAQNTAVTNSFVVKVNAAEIKHTKKNQMRIYANPGYTSIWCEGDAGKQFVSYNIKAPLQFEGNNIKTVTYRINKGHLFRSVPATREAEAEESLEPGRWKLPNISRRANCAKEALNQITVSSP